MRKQGVVGVLLTAAAAVCLVAAPARADTVPAKPAVPTERVKAVCTRVDLASQRVAETLGILQAGPNTKGSIAYLQARITKATSAGRQQEATQLTGRLAVRNDRLALLKDRQTLLATYKQDCAKALGSA